MKFGIDLGTTYSLIARINGGNAEVIQNQQDEGYTTASVVYLNQDPPIVGKLAKSYLSDPDEKEFVAQFVKEYMGKPNAPKYKFRGKEIGAIEVSSLILKELARYAEVSVGETVKDVLITCPAAFLDEERTATRQAGILAGLNVLDIINEPTAAAIAYFHGESILPGTKWNVLVYDLGGGTFDLTLLQYEHGSKPKIDVIASEGDRKLGGKDWDERLYHLMLAEYANKKDISIDEISDYVKDQLRNGNEGAEYLKRSLTKKVEGRFSCSDDSGKRVTGMSVKREDFETETSAKVNSTLSTPLNTIFASENAKNKKITINDIDYVLLVGGSTNMPMIHTAVAEKFPNSTILSKEPELLVAKGAAIAAEYGMYSPSPYKQTLEQQNSRLSNDNNTLDDTNHNGNDNNTVGGGKFTVNDITSYSLGVTCNVTGRYLLDKSDNCTTADIRTDKMFVVDNVICKGETYSKPVSKNYYPVEKNRPCKIDCVNS
jgi:molecular chaperone DnaK (HSP70)